MLVYQRVLFLIIIPTQFRKAAHLAAHARGELGGLDLGGDARGNCWVNRQRIMGMFGHKISWDFNG
jgi:hypothetical protein